MAGPWKFPQFLIVGAPGIVILKKNSDRRTGCMIVEDAGFQEGQVFFFTGSSAPGTAFTAFQVGQEVFLF
jgi:hypothetical protein